MVLLTSGNDGFISAMMVISLVISAMMVIVASVL